MNYPDYSLEDEARAQGFKYVVGTDEAGRGPGAGPVVAAAVHIPDDALPKLVGRVNDSKKLSAKKREELYKIIIESCDYGVQEIEAEVIDKINILEATKIAMRAAIEQIEYFDFILIDGTVDLRDKIECPQRRVIKGDSVSVSIAAASIIAKVNRDRIMVQLHERYPQYNFLKNKGYLTSEHMNAIRLYGPTDMHRLTFNKVKEFNRGGIKK